MRFRLVAKDLRSFALSERSRLMTLKAHIPRSSAMVAATKLAKNWRGRSSVRARGPSTWMALISKRRSSRAVRDGTLEIRLNGLTLGCLSAKQERLRKRTSTANLERAKVLVPVAFRQLVPALDLRHQPPKTMRPI